MKYLPECHTSRTWGFTGRLAIRAPPQGSARRLGKARNPLHERTHTKERGFHNDA
jgi:hypothetical protein